ncbi:MAG: ABC transporter ATP-binding protein [Thermotogaceae bacterium]|nr:ABC transporter ATP-binding protein [Thermotogaceae bacterium]
MLEVKGLNVKYGEIHAVRGVDLEVREGEIVSLIGANGAGKTSTLGAIMGILKAKTDGKIVFEGKDISGLSAWNRAKLGITIVPERARIFANMTVYENLEVGGYLLDKETFKERLEFVYSLFPRLAERKKQLALTLSGGEKQMLAIGRALMLSPKLLLVDEISLGLMPKLVDEIFKVIFKLREKGITVLISEQNTKKALQISDRAYVLQNGKIFKFGNSKELMEDEDIKRAYLGV